MYLNERKATSVPKRDGESDTNYFFALMYRGKFRKKKNFVQFVQNTKICSKANLSTFEQIFALLNKS